MHKSMFVPSNISNNLASIGLSTTLVTEYVLYAAVSSISVTVEKKHIVADFVIIISQCILALAGILAFSLSLPCP